MYMSFTEIHVAQKQPLEYKIETAVSAIASGFAACKSRTALAFSGGKICSCMYMLIYSKSVVTL